MFRNVWKKRQAALAKKRANVAAVSALDFGIKASAKAQVDILNCVLSELHGYLYEKDLILKPEDDLEWVLGIDQTEVTDIFETLVSKVNCGLPENVCVLPPIRTVGDLVKEITTFCLPKA